jgi:DNA-binding NarL/FixJ family response regulator
MANAQEPTTRTVLLYSDDEKVRERMRLAIGARPAADLAVTFVECADQRDVIRHADEHDVDLLLLDGEAWPAGGIGIAHQVKEEVLDPPVTVVVVGRDADRWLAAWSLADAVLAHPLDPVTTAETLADLLRQQSDGRVATNR